MRLPPGELRSKRIGRGLTLIGFVLITTSLIAVAVAHLYLNVGGSVYLGPGASPFTGNTLKRIALWVLAAGFGCCFISMTVHIRRLARLRRRDRCHSCGYALTGLTQPRCPECGELFSEFMLEINRHAEQIR